MRIFYFICLKVAEGTMFFLYLIWSQWLGALLCANPNEHWFWQTFVGFWITIILLVTIGVIVMGVYQLVKLNWQWAKKLKVE